jgi:hypothetical protein
MRMSILHHSLILRHRIVSVPCFLQVGCFPLRPALRSCLLRPSDSCILSIIPPLRTGLTSTRPVFLLYPPKVHSISSPRGWRQSTVNTRYHRALLTMIPHARQINLFRARNEERPLFRFLRALFQCPDQFKRCLHLRPILLAKHHPAEVPAILHQNTSMK